MKTIRYLPVLLALLGLSGSRAVVAAPRQETIRVLVVTGGHAFEKGPFFKLFEDNQNISFRAVTQTIAQAMFRPEKARDFDVLVMYDYNQQISDEAKSDFLGLLRAGKGLVVLHHAIVAYPKWPEYCKIIGARYYLEKTVVDGVEKSRSQWKHDCDFRVHVADPAHPVTQGLSDFDLHDESYKGYDVFPDCHPLLTTDDPQNNPVLAWAKTYGASRVVYIQCGHDHSAYENPNYQRLLAQAITWTAAARTFRSAETHLTALSADSQSGGGSDDAADKNVRASEGYKPLFDGATTKGWHTFHKSSFPGEGWIVEDGWLHCLGQHGGDIVSEGLYDQFDLQWEWKIARVGNSGVKYFVLDSRKSPLGHEYQMLDDEREPDGKLAQGKRITASFYDVLKPMVKTPVHEPGEINQSRILVRGNHVEHWLNGVKVLEYECGSPELKDAVAHSKFKDLPGFGERGKGHILLQDHHSEVWFRNIRIRELSGDK